MITNHRIACWAAVAGMLLSPAAMCQSHGIVADYLMTQSQPIGSDNSIERTAWGEFAIDGAGRSRFELENVIILEDPVRGLSWNVDTVKGIAYEYRHNATAPSPPKGGNDASKRWPDELVVPQRNLWESDGSLVETAELGVQTVNGVECSGRRWIHLIPEGALGNVNPIEVVTEAWVSDTFGFHLPVKIVVQSAVSGTRTRELRHIREKSFDSAYFQPDDGTEIKEEEAHHVER